MYKFIPKNDVGVFTASWHDSSKLQNGSELLHVWLNFLLRESVSKPVEQTVSHPSVRGQYKRPSGHTGYTTYR